jgi:hypothetical protein
MVKTTIVIALGAVLISLPGSAQQLRGRVVAEATRAPLADATVSLLVGDSSVVARVASGSDGFFTLMLPGPGSYLIEVELLGYASTTRPMTIVGADSISIPAFVLTESAIRLDSIVANVRPDSVGLEVGFSHAAHLVAGARLALLERQGMRMAAVLRQLGGVRVREITRPPRGICVTSNRAMQPMNSGRAVCAVAVVDGVVLGDGSVQFLYQLQAYDVESIQYLPPVEAGLKYGMQASAYGAIEIWTRGKGPHRSDERTGGV